MMVDSAYEELGRIFHFAFLAHSRIMATIFIIVSLLFVCTSWIFCCWLGEASLEIELAAFTPQLRGILTALSTLYWKVNNTGVHTSRLTRFLSPPAGE